VDTFDPKPELARLHGKPLPMDNLKTERRTGAAFQSPFKFTKYGQSGIDVSELFPHVAEHIDDIAVIRSMHADVPNHEPSLLLMNCGDARLPRPSMGSWVTYGLGTMNQNLPGFLVFPGWLSDSGIVGIGRAFLPGILSGHIHQHQHQEIEAVEHRTSLNRSKNCDNNSTCCVNSAATQRPRSGCLEARIRRLGRIECKSMQRMLSISKEPKYPRDHGSGTQARQLLIGVCSNGVRFVRMAGAGPALGHHDD
jgi:hypothetical protein